MNRRPQLSLVGLGPHPPDPEEAAAIVAALERFMRDTAPVAAATEPAPNLWRQAALHEGVDRAPHGPPAPWA